MSNVTPLRGREEKIPMEGHSRGEWVSQGRIHPVSSEHKAEKGPSVIRKTEEEGK